MSKIQNINEKYELANVYEQLPRVSRLLQTRESPYDPDLARARVIDVSESVTLACYFYRPISGTTVNIRNSSGIKGSGIFTITGVSPPSRIFTANTIGTFTNLNTTLVQGDIVEFDDRTAISSSVAVPTDFPLVYGRCTRDPLTLRWTISNVIGDITKSIEDVRFVFALPTNPITHTQINRTISNVSLTGFDTPQLSFESYHQNTQNPQFFYSITTNN